MGKVLETLTQGGAPEARPRETTAEPRTEEGVSFIEIGGRQTVMEASPDVLATVPAVRGPALTSPPSVRGPRFQRQPAPAPAAEVRSVHFRPAGGAPGPGGGRFASELVTFHQPEHPVSRQYQGLAATLAAQLPRSGCGALLFTGAAEGVGTTTVLLNLAIAFAADELRVVVVDANTDNPAVAGRLGLFAAPGLREVLSGDVPLALALQETGQANLQALTAGEGKRGVPLRGPGEALRAVLRQLRERCDRILIDTRCAEREAAPLVAICDVVYLVSSEAQLAQVARLAQAVTQQGGRVGGQILSGA